MGGEPTAKRKAQKGFIMANSVSSSDITLRQYHEAVISGNITDAIIAKARAEIAKLDATNAKRAEKAAEKAKENEPIKQAIHNLLAAKGAMTSPDIAMALNEQGVTNTDGEPISTSKASSMCRQMVVDGQLSVEEIKVPKKGKLKQYAVATTADAE